MQRVPSSAATTASGVDPRKLLRDMFDAAVARAQPARVVAAHLPPPPRGRTVVIGAGKAAAAMAQAVEAAWPRTARLSGVVVTRYGHVPPRPAGLPQRIRVLEASHPVPDEACVSASAELLAAVRGLRADDRVVCLMSGGASSLLTLPPEGMTLADEQALNRALLASGAPIDEMNCVRAHLSRIRGGRLALACAPAQLLTLVISDVPGDDPAVVGSGPTLPDATTCADALAVLARRGIAVPAAVEAALRAGALETPKSRDPAFRCAPAVVIANPLQSLEAAAAVARAAGLDVHLLGDALEGEARELGRSHAAIALSAAHSGRPLRAPCVILSGGEATVSIATVRDGGGGSGGSGSSGSSGSSGGGTRGRGGRAGEFCLGLVQGLDGATGVWGLAADTDGIDGVEDNAGAFIAPDTLARARRAGLDLGDHLARHDSYGYFAALGDLLVCGPTHTNVNDFRAMLVL